MLPGSTPVVGALVLTADGSEIGNVEEVTGTLFKVADPDDKEGDGYWLGFDAIASLENGVQLNVGYDSLDEAKQAAPTDLSQA